MVELYPSSALRSMRLMPAVAYNSRCVQSGPRHRSLYMRRLLPPPVCASACVSSRLCVRPSVPLPTSRPSTSSARPSGSVKTAWHSPRASSAALSGRTRTITCTVESCSRSCSVASSLACCPPIAATPRSPPAPPTAPSGEGARLSMVASLASPSAEWRPPDTSGSSIGE